MDSRKLLLKIAQVATVEEIMGRKGITRLYLKGGVEVKVRGTESGIGFGVLDADGEMHHYGMGELDEARQMLSRWANAPEWANELVLNDDCDLFWCNVYPEPDKEVTGSFAHGVHVNEDFEYESRPVID